MPRGVAYSPEKRSFIMELHVHGRSLSELSRKFGIPCQVLSGWWQRVLRVSVQLMSGLGAPALMRPAGRTGGRAPVPPRRPPGSPSGAR